ncbi:MAG: LptA/OstA family protein [Desulfatitalea sp.]
MKRSLSDIKGGNCIAIVWGLALLLWGLPAAGTLWAADGTATPPPANPIHITADQLVSDTAGRTAEFIGNVKVVQGQTTITSDRLKLNYKGGSKSPTQTDADSIDTIEAQGHVRMEMDNRVAVAEKAVYTTADRKLVLSGPGAQISSGPDVVEGTTITFFRDSGRVEMVGQVKAIIRSDQRGLN